jgi:hypothetical protein
MNNTIKKQNRFSKNHQADNYYLDNVPFPKKENKSLT